MSNMSELAIDIEEMLLDGIYPTAIARELNIPMDWVYAVQANMESVDPDPGDMDGDLASGLSSIGWGTDEDYGYYGDDGG